MYLTPDPSRPAIFRRNRAYFLNVHYQITRIFPSVPRYSKWFRSLRFPQQNIVCTSVLPYLFPVLFSSGFPNKTLCAPHFNPIYSKCSFPQVSLKNLVCTSPQPNLFQVVLFPQVSPTKSCVHLTLTLFIPSALFLRFPQQNLLCNSTQPCLFQVVLFPQVSPTKPCVHLNLTLFIPSTLSLRFPQQNLVCTSL
jgi:hypothetical protein